MIPPNSSLVKYDNPVLVSRNTDKKSPKARSLKVSQQQGAAVASPGPVPQPPRTNKLPPMDAQKNQQTDEILNAILPPREWTENGQLWVQQVSSTPATRLDVVNLQEQLDMRLQQRQARETGICPVRRELYSQCFDELIRQVTINCAERGLLLLRVRDEIRMTIAAYQTLYESSVAFGMRKALQAEQGKADMERKIQELEGDKRDLERQVNELKAKCDAIEKREAERRAVEEKKHAEEIQFLKRTNQQLKVFMESTSLSYVSAILYACFVFLAKYVAATSFKGTIEYGDGDVIRYANFVPFYNHKLNHSVGETRMVNSEEECIQTCTEKEHCLSVNFKTTPKANANKKYICEVLNTDKFNSYNFFVAALDFNHYSFTTPCERSPCKNGGTCHAVDNWRDFRCDCLPSTRGRTCSEVPYKDCVELLNAGIRNTGVHIILDKSWALPTYCDQDYMGGGWLMVFKVVAGRSHDVEAIWSRDSAQNVARTSTMNVNSSDKRCYKGRRIGYWENLLKPKEARLALYKKESLVLSLVFNATDSNKTNWFSKSRLLQSPWTEDLQSEQQNFFSLVGDLSTKRAFFINKVNGSCSGDIGWLMVTSGDSCSYETQYWQLSFLYSKLHTRVNWNDHGNVGAADVLAVFIR